MRLQYEPSCLYQSIIARYTYFSRTESSSRFLATLTVDDWATRKEHAHLACSDPEVRHFIWGLTWAEFFHSWWVDPGKSLEGERDAPRQSARRGPGLEKPCQDTVVDFWKPLPWGEIDFRRLLPRPWRGRFGSVDAALRAISYFLVYIFEPGNAKIRPKTFNV